MEAGFKKLKVYKLSYELAMQIFAVSKAFPIEEKYSLTDQIRRSSRSINANIAEAYRKRIYPNHFISKMTDADTECSETSVWLDFAYDCNYISESSHKELIEGYSQVGKMIGYMIKYPEKFAPKNKQSP
ncbi:MAG: four helix bundle protein [Balneolaceae bacterium]